MAAGTPRAVALVPMVPAALGTLVACWFSIPLSEALGVGETGVLPILAVVGVVLTVVRYTRRVGIGVLAGLACFVAYVVTVIPILVGE